MASGKFAGTVGGIGDMQELIDMGYQFIGAGADVVGLPEYFKQIVAGFEGTKAPNSKSVYKGK